MMKVKLFTTYTKSVTKQSDS